MSVFRVLSLAVTVEVLGKIREVEFTAGGNNPGLYIHGVSEHDALEILRRLATGSVHTDDAASAINRFKRGLESGPSHAMEQRAPEGGVAQAAGRRCGVTGCPEDAWGELDTCSGHTGKPPETSAQASTPPVVSPRLALAPPPADTSPGSAPPAARTSRKKDPPAAVPAPEGALAPVTTPPPAAPTEPTQGQLASLGAAAPLVAPAPVVVPAPVSAPVAAPAPVAPPVPALVAPAAPPPQAAAPVVAAPATGGKLSPEDPIPDELMKATKLKDVILFMRSIGMKEATEMIAYLEAVKPKVPCLKVIAGSLAERVTRALDILADT